MLLILTFILLTIITIIILFQNKYINNEKFQIHKRSCLKNIEKKSYNDPLTTAKCWITKDWPCPKDNGSFIQCTNNYKHPVNIADCLERSYYYSSKDERLSEKSVYKKVFPFALKKNIPNTSTPSIFPRINTWRNNDFPNQFLVDVN